MFRVGFFFSASFLVVVLALDAVMGRLPEALVGTDRLFHAGATGYLALLAIVAHRGRLQALWAVSALDVVGVLGAIVLLDANLLFVGASDLGVFDAVTATGVVIWLRAVIVPSSVRRTLLVSVLGAAGSLAVVAAAGAQQDLLVAALLWLAGFTACAAVTSKVVFGLRQEIHAARQIGAYVLHDRLGEGGMGVVYRATHALLKRETAVKLVRKSKADSLAVARFEREVVLTARLSHPNTVAIYDYGRTPEGEFYYAMEYLEGLTLQELVERSGPLSPGRAIAILSQICGSLDEAHRLGLVHRDIKPANIMVTCRGSVADLVKVLDFGLVKDFEHPGAALSTAGLVGTPMTMSPEAIAHPGSIGPASDLYALGAVAYFLLTGAQVFDGDTLVAVCAQHLYQPPVPPSRLGAKIPADLEALVLSLLEKDPAARPGSAAEVRARLGRCQEVEGWTEADAALWWREVGERALAERERERARGAGKSNEAGRTLNIDASYQSNPCLPMNSLKIEVGGT